MKVGKCDADAEEGACRRVSNIGCVLRRSPATGVPHDCFADIRQKFSVNAFPTLKMCAFPILSSAAGACLSLLLVLQIQEWEDRGVRRAAHGAQRGLVRFCVKVREWLQVKEMVEFGRKHASGDVAGPWALPFKMPASGCVVCLYLHIQACYDASDALRGHTA